MSLLNSIMPGIDKLLPLLDPELWLYVPNMQCNSKCTYCYMNRAARPRGQAIHSCEFKLPDTIGQVTGWIILYGGELLTDKKVLRKLITAIRQQTNAPISFSTNGMLLSYSDIRFFSKTNVKISISYDGKYQKYRGIDPIGNKKHFNVIKKAYKKNVIFGINTVVHSKNLADYKFNIPGLQVIHDYNFIYPIETDTNRSFLLREEDSDTVAGIVADEIKGLLSQCDKYTAERLVLKYPPYIFSLLNNMLNLYGITVNHLNADLPMCKQSNCLHLDIYGNKVCGKGCETQAVQTIPLGTVCASCKYSPICTYKCPINNFARPLCKNFYMYKVYSRIDDILQSILSSNQLPE